MKKITKILALLLIALCFTSCIDYVQTISYKDGKYEMYYKVTLSKMLLALAQQDPEDLLGGLNESGSMEGLPETVSIKPVDTDLEIGLEISCKIDPRNATESEKELLPKHSKTKYYIPFFLGRNESLASPTSSGVDDSFAQAFLASAKCRIMISKKIMPYIESAWFTGYEKADYEIPVFDYGESYCIEIPFLALVQSGYRTDRIVVLTE